MKRFWIALSLLTVIISLCIAEQIVINKIAKDLSYCLEDNLENLYRNDYENLSYTNDMMLKKWENYEKKLSVFMQHDNLNNLKESILIINPNIENRNYSQIFIELEKIKFYIEDLKSSESPLIYNIL